MSFITKIDQYEGFNFEQYLNTITERDIEVSLTKERKTEKDFLNLLSDKALPYLEKMAQLAHEASIQNFGRTIQLYIPLYLANYCSNDCVYCGFSRRNRIHREVLTIEEIEKNAKTIAKTNIRHILILTGESPELTPVSYLSEAVRVLKRSFSSISIEIFPMETRDYLELKAAGVDGLTVYQETYDRKVYETVHVAGRKKDYLYRLDTPERGAEAGLRWVNIGALYGLADPLKDAFLSGLHVKYLQDNYMETEFGVSFPRMNEAEGNFKSLNNLSDKKFVQFILAFRLFLPRAGITLSTRERPDFRDNLIQLGITKMSAGSVTSVGGYVESGNTPQFEISDSRSVSEIAKVIESKGYEPVYKDWEPLT